MAKDKRGLFHVLLIHPRRMTQKCYYFMLTSSNKNFLIEMNMLKRVLIIYIFIGEQVLIIYMKHSNKFFHFVHFRQILGNGLTKQR